MKRILYLVPYHALVPFYCQLSRYLHARGYEPHFVAFLLREHLWLRRNNLRPVPEDVYAVAGQPIRRGVLTPAEVRRALAFAIGKSGGIRAHWEERLLRLASFLDELLETRRYDAAFIWNGHELSARALAILAAKRGIPTVFAENGYFPNTLQLDLEGVNVESSIARLAFADIVRPRGHAGIRTGLERAAFALTAVKPLPWRDLARCFLARKLDREHYRKFPEHLGSSWFAAQWLRLRRAMVPEDRVALPGKFVFIPFQVHDDTQILLNSRLCRTMETFFEVTYAAVRRTFGHEYAVVVKEHPEDLCRRSYTRLRERYPEVIWLKKYDVDELLNRAACVFVVNSSVGLQAIARGKPTVVCGESFYTRDEIAYRVTDLAAIDGVVRRALGGVTPDRQANIEAFLRFVNEHYFVAAGWKRITPAGVANAGNRVIELIAQAAARRTEQQECIQQT